MCPFSDLEFAFVIEKETPEALSYFRLLARFLQLRSINFGETKAEVFGPQESSPTPSGFCMDSGGNVPLGGIFELISTPEKLALTQTSQWIEDNIILANVMSTVCVIMDENNLAERYLEAKTRILNQEKGSLFSRQKNAHKLALKLLAGHLQEFLQIFLNKEKSSKLLGSKKSFTDRCKKF